MFRSAIFIALLTATSWTQADGTIAGKVIPMGYIEPLHPVAVTVLDPLTGEAIPGLYTVNLEDGTYEINGVPEGDYKVFYDAIDEADRHIDELSGNVQCDNGDCDRAALGKVVHVLDGETTTLNITLVDGMWIRGKVMDSARQPLPGVTVEFYDVAGNPYCCKRITDEKGNFAKPVFWPRGYYAVARFAEPSSYQPQVYQDQPCSGCEVATTGKEIYVEYGGRSGINFSLPMINADPGIAHQAVSAHKLSGSWFNPDRPGEGFIVEVLDQATPDGTGQTAVVFWFTFTPDGHQAWMVGSGPISGGVAEIKFEITNGASFGADFDSSLVTRKSWGSLRLEFLNCSEAQAEYGGTFGSGQLTLTRLTAIHGLGCADADDAMASGSSAISGAWFNPDRDGQGFIFETIDETQVLGYWFTYDTDGRQMWMLGIGTLDDASVQVQFPMQRASGGRFGDAFDPDNVVLDNWGEVILRINACDDASYSWEAPPPYGAGGYELSRLTALKNVSCQPAPEPGNG